MRAAAVLMAALLLAPAASAGQGSLSFDTVGQRWSWEKTEGGETTDLDQITGRVVFAYAFNDRITVEAAGGAFALRWEGFQAEGNSEDLEGLLDTRVRLTYTAGDRLMIRAGFNGPTGTKEFSLTELPLAQAVTARILEMEGNRLGEGADADFGLSYAFPAGPASIGVGVGYLIKGGYVVLKETPEYVPGDQLSIGAGVDFGNAEWLWRTNGRVVIYGEDAFETLSFQQEGARSELQTTLLRRWSRSSVWGSVFLIQFQKAKFLSAGELVTAPTETRGNEVYANLGGKHRLSRRVSGTLIAGIRSFNGNGFDLGKSFRGELEATLAWDPNLRLGFEFLGGYSSGTLDQPVPVLGNVDKAGLSGVTAGLRLVLRF